MTWSVKIPCLTYFSSCYFVSKNYWYLNSEIFNKKLRPFKNPRPTQQSRVAEYLNRVNICIPFFLFWTSRINRFSWLATLVYFLFPYSVVARTEVLSSVMLFWSGPLYCQTVFKHWKLWILLLHVSGPTTADWNDVLFCSPKRWWLPNNDHFFHFQIATPGSIYKDVEPYKIRQKILLFLSPFCPSRLLYTELKVQAATVHEEMKALEEEGLGHVYTHGNKTVFSKVVPSKVDEEKLRGYNVEKSSFENSFLETNSKISAELFVTFLQKAPNSMEINEVLYPGVYS